MARPPVCKLMDYGKFKYESALKARESRKNQAQTVIKEIKLRPKIDPHDYGTKKGHVERFLKQGDKVKVTIMFRGREQSRPELGFKLLQRLASDVEELGFVESTPKQDGRNMIMVIGPHKRKTDAMAAAKAERATERASRSTGRGPAGSEQPEAMPDIATEAEQSAPAEAPARAARPAAATPAPAVRPARLRPARLRPARLRPARLRPGLRPPLRRQRPRPRRRVRRRRVRSPGRGRPVRPRPSRARRAARPARLPGLARPRRVPGRHGPQHRAVPRPGPRTGRPRPPQSQARPGDRLTARCRRRAQWRPTRPGSPPPVGPPKAATQRADEPGPRSPLASSWQPRCQYGLPVPDGTPD